MKVAVTGASGFIGSHVIVALIEAGHEPVAYVRSQARLARAMDMHGIAMPKFVVGDINDAVAIVELCRETDAIVHTAGVVTTKAAEAETVMLTNAGGTRLVIDSAVAAGLDPVIHVSSVAAVFPTAGGSDPANSATLMTSEDPLTSSSSVYAQSKAGAEQVARQAQSEGKPVVIFYPGGVFGPNDPGTSDIIDGTLLMLDKGAFVLPKGRGNAFIDVRDLARAIANSVVPDRGPRRFMAGGTWVGWDEWIGHFTKNTDAKIRIITLSAPTLHRIGSALDWVADRIASFDAPITAEMAEFMSWAKPTDDSLIAEELGVTYRPVSESVADFVAWLRADGRL